MNPATDFQQLHSSLSWARHYCHPFEINNNNTRRTTAPAVLAPAQTASRAVEGSILVGPASAAGISSPPLDPSAKRGTRRETRPPASKTTAAKPAAPSTPPKPRRHFPHQCRRIHPSQTLPMPASNPLRPRVTGPATRPVTSPTLVRTPPSSFLPPCSLSPHRSPEIHTPSLPLPPQLPILQAPISFRHLR